MYDKSNFGTRETGEAEIRALRNMLPDPYTFEVAINTRPEITQRYSPLAQIGALGLRELQLAKAHGSKDVDYLGAPVGEHSFARLFHPMDPVGIKHATDVARREGTASWGSLGRMPDDPASAFGPALMGRVGTTEALIRGAHQGRTPDEVMDELMRYRDAENALKGRYATGGAINAAIAD